MSSAPTEESVVPPALGQAWRAGKPSASELQRGYARYLRRRAPQKRAFGVARWVVAGLVLGAGLAQAASMTPWQRWFGQNELVLPHAPVKAPAPSPNRAAPGIQATPSSAPVMAPAPVVAPAPVIVAPSAASAPRAATTPPAPSTVAFRIQEQWRLAAEGLRNGDFNGAHQALLELERTTVGGERDAARLARAQLLSSHGRSAEALALGSELEAHASSSLVREKARDLRLRLTKDSAGDRSPSMPPGINQP